MYFYENKQKGYFVIQMPNGEYLVTSPSLSHTYDDKFQYQNSFFDTEHDPRLTYAKKHKRAQDLFTAVRNLVKNHPLQTFYQKRHKDFALHTELEFESSSYYLTKYTVDISLHAVSRFDFTILNNITVIKRDTENKCNISLQHDFEAYLKHHFYRSRSNAYFTPALTNLIMTQPNFIHEDKNKCVFIVFNDKGMRNIDLNENRFFLKKEVNLFFKAAGLTKKDISFQIHDGTMAILLHDIHKKSMIESLLNSMSTAEYETFTVADVLQQQEIDIASLYYTQPTTPVLSDNITL